MLMAPARRTAPSILEARVEAIERVLAGILIDLVEKPRRRTAPATTSKIPKAQRRLANMEAVGTLRQVHPDWPMRQIAAQCGLKLDYANQLWRDYRAANGISAVRERSR